MQIVGWVLVALGAATVLGYLSNQPFSNPAYRSPGAGLGCAALPLIAGVLLLLLA